MGNPKHANAATAITTATQRKKNLALFARRTSIQSNPTNNTRQSPKTI
jgi:hypothetical protein